MVSLVETLGERLECAICLEQYKEPKVLSCLHSYCRGCLEKLVKRVEDKYAIKCPECRHETEVAEGNLDGLHSNFFINNVLEVMSLHSDNGNNDGSHVICENCDSEDKAVKRCKVCCMFMCRYCAEAHRRFKATKEHRLMTLEELKTAGTRALAKPSFCIKHKGEVLKLFCQSPSCNRPICRDCIVIDHKDHKYVFIDDIAEEEKDVLRKLINDVNTKAPSFDEAVKEIERAEEQLSETVVKINKKIDDFIDGIIEVIEQKRSNLKDDVERIATAKNKQLRAEKDEVALVLASMRSSVNFAEHALDNCEDVEILAMKKDVVQRLAELKTKECLAKITHALEVVFVTESPDLKASIMNVASVSEKKEKNCQLEEEGCQMASLAPLVSSNNAQAERQDGSLGRAAAEDLRPESKFGNFVVSRSCSAPIKRLVHCSIEIEKVKFSKPRPSCAAMCVLNIVGNPPGVMRSLRGKSYEFVLFTKDEYGKLQDRGGDEIVVTVRKQFVRWPTTQLLLIDNKNGSYTFSYTPPSFAAGTYIINVTVNGKEIKKGGIQWEIFQIP